MSNCNKSGLTFFLAILMVFTTVTASAGMWDDPQNIKVLDEDITADELRHTMRSFAISTGSRCSSCHVYENEADLRTYDFAADEKERKHKAREMIKLVNDINSRLEAAFEQSQDEIVRVDCATCHRGNNKPEKIQNVLKTTLVVDGLEEATLSYRKLRDRYYGGYTFDFSEPALVFLAEEMTASNDNEAALGFLDLNLEFYPRSLQTLVMKGQILEKTGETAAAKNQYLKALEIDPDSAWVKQLLAAIDVAKPAD